MRGLLLCALAMLGAQESNEDLVRRLAAGRIEERQESARELVRRGKAAVPALVLAVGSPDADLAARATLCLEKIAFAERLTLGLQAVDGLSERLRRSPKEWAAVLAEALPSPERLKAYRTLGTEDLSLLAREALRASNDPGTLLPTLQAVGKYRLVGALEAAGEKAGHADPLVRRWTAHARVLLAGDRGLEVAEPYLKDRDEGARNGAVDALAELKLPGTGARLAAVATQYGLNWDVSGAFWKLRAKEGIPFLEAACRIEGHNDLWTRCMGAMHLSFYAGPEQIPLFRDLLRWVQSDPNTGVNAIRYLGDWGDRESIPAIEKAIASDRLWANCPTAAARALYQMGATGSRASLLKLAQEGEGRHEAVQVLGRMGDRGAIPALREYLSLPNEAAVIALAELGDRESISAIRAFLGNRDRRWRGVACTALALLDDCESIPAVAKLGAEADTARRIWPALGQERPDAAVLRPGPDGSVRGGSEYAAQIQDGTRSNHGFLRYIGARAVATARAGADAAMLRTMLDEERDSIKLYAAAALVRMGHRDGLPVLLGAEQFPAALNRLRRPEVWAALDGKPTSLTLYAPYREIHARLAAEAGFRLEGPPPGSDAHKAWSDVHDRLRKWGRPASIAEAFELVEDDRWSVVVEADRIRIVPADQAKELWTRWAEGKEK